MSIIGHQKIQRFLSRSIEKNVVSHAYIFAGSRHLGKFSAALDFAKKLTGNGADVNPRTISLSIHKTSGYLRQNGAGVNPDIIIVEPDMKETKGIMKEENIKIEKIRELQHQLGTTSHFGKSKVAIIDGADKINKSAQNAMLKTLEDPADRTVVILIAHDLDKLLPTIRSRCVTKKFSLVSREEIEKIIPDGAKNREEIIFWSLGRPGLAKKMAEDPNELKRRQEAEKELCGLISSNVSDKLALAEKMGKDVPAMAEKLSYWSITLRENLMGRRRSISFSSSRSLSLISEIEKSLGIIRETNSNARLVLENLLINF